MGGATEAFSQLTDVPGGAATPDSQDAGDGSTSVTQSIGALGDVSVSAQQDASLIRLDQFRADLRFSGINGAGQTVVVIDTGIDLNHSFFGADANGNGIADRIVYSYDYYSANDSNASDYNGHGSNVASIIGSQDATYTGMAPGCNIIALKVFPDGSGSASSTDIIEALNWVVANRATYNIVAVNMSLGQGDNVNSATSSIYSSQIRTLHDNGCAVVIASGNEYAYYQSVGVSQPSADPNAWSVGAVWDRNVGSSYGYDNHGSLGYDYTTAADRITSFSQRSPTMTTIFAPGGAITGASWNGGTTTMSGTSQAAPHIAGLIANMQQLAVQVSGRTIAVDTMKALMVNSGATIYDGDDENDNVLNSYASYKRVDALAWGVAELDYLFAGTASNDALNGTAAGDRIRGASGNDALRGNAGNDVLIGDGNVLWTDNAAKAYRLYLAALGRAPDEGGHSYWVEQLDAGVSLTAAAAGFLGSNEFIGRFGSLNDSQFITLMYNNALHRGPEAGAISYWQGRLNAGVSRASVMVGFSESGESIGVNDMSDDAGQVFRLYEAALARTPDVGGFDHWLSVRDGGTTVSAMAAGFLASNEFNAKYGSLNDSGFISQVYVNALGRGPESSGAVNYWLGVLANGGRAAVLSGISESLEAKTLFAGSLDSWIGTSWIESNDTLVGGAGNDSMYGARGSNLYSFDASQTGFDDVYGLHAWDRLQLLGYGYSAATALNSHMVQNGANVFFFNGATVAGSSEVITFHNTSLDTLKTIFNAGGMTVS